MTQKLSDEYKETLKKQQYELCGEWSAVKICTWTKRSLLDRGFCYKQKFYGIRSHLCCQITPSLGYCQNRCVFCWRELESTLGHEMDECDEPHDIITGAEEGQNRLLSGFGGNEDVNLDKLKESGNPQHFAISLSGEPLIYPKMNELIGKLHEMGKSTFVVTNGMLPDRLKELSPPTQLYLSVDAPNERLFRQIDRSVMPDGWDRLNLSLDIMRERKNDTRTTLRFTLIKGMNMVHPEEWASIIKKSEPLFVEVKAYMFVGSSRLRLSMENMPRHKEVREFAQEICKHCGYQIIDEKEESRVVLLAVADFEGRIMKFD
ncbi:4-demethylwyosine synthase TYW1 [Candidatus Woesearchaeota archaeon]|nr:4-demethylwyosine synthase TYW1 [Candidatus Woesearchaeota archaeon]